MSCNGCRVLRKGCSENCCIRPCIEWINNPEAEGNATLFLAKFYGRAGLINLIESGPQQQRPALFRSLLYEACGRIVNPIFGSVGLVCSGSWNICEQAVDAVLRGAPIAAIPNFRAYDIRHVPKGPEPAIVVRNGARFRHSTPQTGPTQLIDAEVTVEASNVIHIAGDQKEMEAREKDSGLNLTLRLALPSA